MNRGKASGFHLYDNDIPIVLGMVARGDREHDIAAWFGVNQGRIADAKKGKYGSPRIASFEELPPKGAPGVKGRRLRARVGAAIQLLRQPVPDTTKALQHLLEGAICYDEDEA